MSYQGTIEVGKFYSSRGGEQVRIYATDAGGRFPLHGSIKQKGRWVVRAWTSDGQFFSDGETTNDDIAGEWTDPPKPPKYYPFNDEQLKDCIGSRVVQKDNGLSRQIGFEVGHGVVHVLGANLNVTAFDLLEYFTWADGTPCGVLCEEN